MIKILAGLVAVVAIAVGWFFGFQFYTQHRIAGEVEAAFEQIRAAGGKASHGKVSFDLPGRTLSIVDIAVDTTAQPPLSVKVASFTAAGTGQPDAARFSADSIEITDINIGVAMTAQPALKLAYKVPRITVKDYFGPAGLQKPPASSSAVDVYRFAIEQFAGITAASITAPSLAATVNSGAATAGGGNVAYSGLAMQGIKDGKIASTKIDGVVFTVNAQPAGKAESLTGNLANVVSYDIDINAIAAILDPQKVNDDRYYRSYRQISAGPYVVTSGQGLNMRIDGMTIDELGLRPSRLQLPALLAMIPPAGAAPPTPAQAREMLEKAVGLYEGIRIGNAEMRGISIETPQGPVKLAAMRFNLENGKVSEFAIEGLDGRTPQGPVKLGRFALKSLDIANLMRMSALFANPAQQPSPDKALGMIALIEGAELKGLVAPFKNTGKPVNIDTFSLDWGQFIGPIPSKARLTMKMSAPLDANDPGQKVLVAGGLDRAAVDLDLGAAWTETSGGFVLEPVALVGGLLKASARVSLANVPKGVFSTDPAKAIAAAAQLEAGAIELTVRDTGTIDFGMAQYARALNVSREAARDSLANQFRAAGKEAATTNPDAVAAAEALARFIETPGQTLIIKLAPIGKVPALRLIELFKADPDNINALAQFRIEASTGL